MQQQTLRSQLLVQINGLTARLAEAQQMNPVVRFFKRIDPEKLAQYLNDRQQQMWRLDQRLAALNDGGLVVNVNRRPEILRRLDQILSQRRVHGPFPVASTLLSGREQFRGAAS